MFLHDLYQFSKVFRLPLDVVIGRLSFSPGHHKLKAVQQSFDISVTLAKFLACRKNKVSLCHGMNHTKNVPRIAGAVNHARATYNQAPFGCGSSPAIMNQFRRLLTDAVWRNRIGGRSLGSGRGKGAIKGDAAPEKNV